MKLRFTKVKFLIISCLALVAVAFGAIAFSTSSISVKAAGTTLTSADYSTDGSSIRIFKTADDTEASDKTGLRFHVEMGNGFSYNGTPIVNLSATNENNGAFVLNEGFKTYTLILPTRLLNGELTINTDKVLKLDTSNFWYFDSNGNLESVAYVYNIPNHRYTDKFSFRGIICDADGNVIAQTPTAERCVAEIAKKSYQATKSGAEDWGDDTRKNVALSVLEGFIPTYDVVYQNADGETISSEKVMWGDAPQDAPEGAFNAWYDETASVEVDVNKSMTYPASSTITLTATQATEFSLTGIADINDVAFNGVAYSGAMVYATLPQGVFPYDEEFDLHAVNVEYRGNGTFKGFEKVFVLKEDIYDRLVFAFDSSQMISGAKIIIKGDSVFYIGGKMYQLTEDYEIEYTKDANGNEDYGIFLGYIYNSDVKRIYNYTEERDGEIAKVIRVEFYEDVFVNSTFEFTHDSLPQGYEFPVYIACPQENINKQVTGGRYYWNNGQHQILELNGYGNHHEDELFGAPGTKLVQNGGYYIFQDEMHAYFNGSAWVVGKEIGTFSASSFETIGKNASDTTEIRLNTIDRWWNDAYSVTVENMSNTEPYAVFHTATDGTVTPVYEFHYHGQSYGSGYHKILGFGDVEGVEAGETLTIIAGTRLWKGSEYYTASEDIIVYYNGAKWIVGDDGEADCYVGTDDFDYINSNLVEEGIHKTRLTFTTEKFNGQYTNTDDFPYLYVESGSVKVNGVEYLTLKYHGGGNRIFEIVGDSSKALGSTPYEDRITIEKGTRLWLNDYCLEFDEEVVYVYIGASLKNGSGHLFNYYWVPANKNVNVTNDDVVYMADATDAGGEVRLKLKDGIITNDYYGFMAVDASKGVPVVNGVEFTDQSFCYNQGNDLIAIRGGQCGKYYGNGAYIKIPAGSVWYTSQGSITFTEDIVGVYGYNEWGAGFNQTTLNDTITKNDVERVYVEGTELRVRLSKDLTGYSYYGLVALLGNVSIAKPNGSRYDARVGFWYGGNTGYQAQHSLLGFVVNGLTSFEEGTTLTIPEGTKIAYQSAKGVYGYNEVGEDLVYVYTNGSWVNATGYNVKINYSNASVSVNGKAVQNGETITLYAGGNTVTITPANGYSVTTVTNGTNNFDGTYTVNVTNNSTVTINTKQHIEVDKNAISYVQKYNESNVSPDLTGVRFQMIADRVSLFNKTQGGLSWNGAITTDITGGIYHSTFHADGHNLFELRFNTSNLKAGDTFTIKAGTVFYHDNVTYAFKWTEDVICTYSGSQWYIKLGEIDWNGSVEHIYSYSDMKDDTPINYTVRIKFKQALYNSVFGYGTAISNVTINGAAYTGRWAYHGGGNEILELSEWNYKSGDVLVIPAGTKIFICENHNNGAYYYETVNTLTATCSANGTGAAWTWTIS